MIKVVTGKMPTLEVKKSQCEFDPRVLDSIPHILELYAQEENIPKEANVLRETMEHTDHIRITWVWYITTFEE